MSISSLAGLSLRDLEYALAVDEHRHFGRAAAACGVSQPGLSEQVRKLETQLGVALFERGRRHVAPTQPGAALLAQAALVVAHARRLIELGERHRDAPLGALRLGVIPTLGPYYLPLVLRPVRARFPSLELVLGEAKTAALLDDLRQARLDVVLAALPLGEDGIEAIALFDEPFHLAVPCGHRLDAGGGETRPALADLAGDGLLLLEEGHCLREQTLSLCRLGAAAPVQPARHASSLEMLRHMIAAGEGHALLPLLAIRDVRDWEGLIATTPLAEAASRRIGIAWRATDPRRAQFRELADFLLAHLPPGTALPGEEGREAVPPSGSRGSGG